MCREFEKEILSTININSSISRIFQLCVDISTETVLFSNVHKKPLSAIWRNILLKKELQNISAP
jgi:hypothetical protein